MLAVMLDLPAAFVQYHEELVSRHGFLRDPATKAKMTTPWWSSRSVRLNFNASNTRKAF